MGKMLDRSVTQLGGLSSNDAFICKGFWLLFLGGIVYFNGSDAELSGDGVVNAASMNVCQQWAKSGVDVGVTFLPGVLDAWHLLAFDDGWLMLF